KARRREPRLHRDHGPLGAQHPRAPVRRGPLEDHVGAVGRRARRRIPPAGQRGPHGEGPQDGRSRGLGRASRRDRHRGGPCGRTPAHREPEGGRVRRAEEDRPLPDQPFDGGEGRDAREGSIARSADLRGLRRGEAPLRGEAALGGDREAQRRRRDLPARDGDHRARSPALRHRAQSRDAGRGGPLGARAEDPHPPGAHRIVVPRKHPRARRLSPEPEEAMAVQELTRKPTTKRPQVAIMNAVHDLPVLVARDNGFFKDEGLDIDFVTTPGMAQVSTKHFVKFDSIFDRPLDSTYNEGGIDQYRMCEWGIMKRAVEANTENLRPRKIVALGAAMSSFAIVVRADSPYYEPEMLKNVPIAVTPNNGSHFTTLKIMEGFLQKEHVKTT